LHTRMQKTNQRKKEVVDGQVFVVAVLDRELEIIDGKIIST